MSGFYSLFRMIREISGFEKIVPHLKKNTFFSSKGDLFINISAILILLSIAFVSFIIIIKVLL